MPIEAAGFGFLNLLTVGLGVKMFLILFLIFYIIFAFVLYRQVLTMCMKLPTLLSPHLKFVSVINIGIAVAVLFLIVGLF